jgi:CheY-like chemotaxis protein
MAKRLMVVDSNLAVQKLVEFSLSKEGFEVISFSDGLSALDAVEKVQPSLVVADYNLPGINIFRFCEKIKKHASAHDRPILLMINYAEPIDREKLKQAGVTDFIKKPVEATDLVEKIKASSKGGEDSAEPTTAMFRPETAQSATEQEEMMKIEELLGWSIPPEQPAPDEPEPEKASSEVTEEITVLASPEEEIIFVDEDQTPASSPALNELREPMADSPLPETPPITVAQEPPIATASPSTTPPSPSVSTPSEAATELIIEQVVWETVPGLAESAVQKLTQELIETIVNKLAREIVEKVAWEVIPNLAESAIQKEIEKLKAEE